MYLAETCPCCGFEIERKIIGYWEPPNSLSFLGSGFPLFYNFMKFCILILLVQLCIKQFYNIYTNYHGTYCAEVKVIHLDRNRTATETNCQQSILLQLSLANKLK